MTGMLNGFGSSMSNVQNETEQECQKLVQQATAKAVY